MNNNNNIFYMNRIIKLISPLTCQTFKIELNGDENELRELLATILEINPKSIKGLRDSYNNYYTLSSAVKNPHINTDPYNYYTVVIDRNNSLKYLKFNSLNIPKKDRKNSYFISKDSDRHRNSLINKSLNYFRIDEDEENTNKFNNYDYDKIEDFLQFAEDLHKKNYIDQSTERKLKKLIKENNDEVLSILNSFLLLKSHKTIDEFVKKIKPVITSGEQKSDYMEETKQNSSSSSSSSQSKESKIKKSIKNEKKSKKNNKNKHTKKDNNTNIKKLSNEEKILEDVKLNFTKDKYLKLKELFEEKNNEIIKIIKFFEKNNDYNLLLSKLSRLVDNFGDNSDDNDDNGDDNEKDEDKKSDIENDSSYYIQEENNEKNSTKNKKDKSRKKNNEEIQKISKNITNSLKSKGKDLYYISKYDLQKLKNEEKMTLFTKKFKLNIEKLNKDNYKIPKKNLSLIQKYYTEYITKKVCKSFNENEKYIYGQLIKEEDEENNIIIHQFKELLTHQNLNELKSRIKKIIKEAEERIEEEENEDDDEEKGKNSIKEENEENEEDEEGEEEEDDMEEEEEEEDGDGEEKEDTQEEKDSQNQTKNDKDSSSNNFILKNDNKDRGTILLNNNYRKINNFSNFAKNDNNNNNNNDNDIKEEEKNEKDNDDNPNLGLGFVVVKQKKSNKLEEKKDESNNNNNKLNSTKSLEKESNQSTNNPNKKLNQFITQIEHLKKIDDIKNTIIDAIHANNKYVMDLFQKFQKNKFNLNPKSLYEVYKQIKDNPDTNSKDYQFKVLIKDTPSLNENVQEFLCEEFTKNKNSELVTFYTLYESTKEKDEFIESIEIFMKKPATKKSLIKFILNKIKSQISPNLLKKNESEENEDLVSKSKEIIKILEKYNLFNEKEYNIIMKSLENDDDVFTATFQVLFDDQDLNEFYETMTLALENQMKKDGNNDANEDKWKIDLIRKNYKELKKRIEEKHYDTLEELYRNKNDNLYMILRDLSSSNIKETIENAKTLILKKELSVT